MPKSVLIIECFYIRLRACYNNTMYCSGAHPASYPMGTGGSFPGGKARPGRDSDHSPPSSVEVKNE
jgi:hypothetical protein